MNRGYTLIEVMVALFIFAIASVLMGQGLIQSLGYRTIIKEQTQSLIDLQRAMTLVQHDLIQATLKPVWRLGRSQGSFVTREGGLQWVRRGYLNPAWSKRQDSFLEVRHEVEADQWVRVVGGGDKPNQRQVLLNQVKALRWTFYDENGRSYPLWPPVQSLQNELPRAVTLELELSTGERFEQTLPLAHYKVRYEKSE